MTAPTEASSRRPPLGRVAAGVLLLVLGVGWLLETTDFIDVDWGAVLPAALIVVGLALLVGSRTGPHGVLVTIGIVLTVILTVASSLDVPLSGGIGERALRPVTADEVRSSYELAIGELTVDLTQVQQPLGGRTIEASVGIGHLVLIVTNCVAGEVRGTVSVGELRVADRSFGGLGVDETVSLVSAKCPTVGELTLDLSVGIGQIEVRA